MAGIVNQQTADEIISIEISDETLEALAFAGHAGAYTQFGLCTASFCPGSSQEQLDLDRHGSGVPDQNAGSQDRMTNRDRA